MRINVALPKSFWAEAVNTAVYLVNRSPSIAVDLKIPKEVWSSQPVNYSNLKIFSCSAYAHVSNGKLEAKAKRCIFLGYVRGVKGLPKIIVSRDVIFDEVAMINHKMESNGDQAKTDHGAKKQVELEIDDGKMKPEEDTY